MNKQDFEYMQLALKASEKNIGITSPNPSVGCVIVKNHRVIATSATAKGGRPHAETIALDLAGKNAEGATMYVTLEPCCHWGVTPPCVDAIIKAKILKVIIATSDIDKRVAGNGIDLLKKAGIIVEVGLCEYEAKKINKAYFKSKEFDVPYITVKIATSLDGKIALSNGRSKWITNELSRDFAHKLRATHDAILVGIGTIRCDDPILDCRIEGLKDHSPDIFIVDKNLDMDEKSKVLNTSKTCYLITDIRNKFDHKITRLEQLKIKFIYLSTNNGYFNIDDMLKSINKIGITSILIEGGASIFTHFVKERKFDQLVWITANIILGNDSLAAIGDLSVDKIKDHSLELKESFFLKDDLIRIFINK